MLTSTLRHPAFMIAIVLACVSLATIGTTCHLEHFGQYMQAVAVLLALFYGFVNTRVASLEKFAIDRWYDMIEFKFQHPEYFDGKKNARYLEAYVGNEAIKYDAAARKCLALVDDMYHYYLTGNNRRMFDDGHYAGTIQVFVRPHEAWLRRNRSSYSSEFYAWLRARLR